jgi:hypothetical protein
MSEIREVYLNKDGQLVLEKDIIEFLHLQDNKVRCILDSDQIILRNPASTVEKLLGCCGEESKKDYDFHIEIKRFGGPNDESR